MTPTVYPNFDQRKAEFVQLIHGWQYRLGVPQMSPACRRITQIFGELEAALEELQETHTDPFESFNAAEAVKDVYPEYFQGKE